VKPPIRFSGEEATLEPEDVTQWEVGARCLSCFPYTCVLTTQGVSGRLTSLTY
jgi:hypothetical protein